MSINLTQTQLQQDVGISITKKAMDNAEQTSAKLLEMI
ncbi:MAG: YjfB family protein, partial [bacterium]